MSEKLADIFVAHTPDTSPFLSCLLKKSSLFRLRLTLGVLAIKDLSRLAFFYKYIYHTTKKKNSLKSMSCVLKIHLIVGIEAGFHIPLFDTKIFCAKREREMS